MANNIYIETIVDLLNQVNERNKILRNLQGYLLEIKREGIAIQGLDYRIDAIEKLLGTKTLEDINEEAAVHKYIGY